MAHLHRVHLNGLRALEAAGRLGSLARAAEELGVTVGAVSQGVIRAEKQLGRVVFARTAHGLAPTAFGRLLLPRLSAGFEALDRALGLAFERQGNVLTLSVAPVFASKWLVPRLASFGRAHPEVQLRLDASVALKHPDRDGIDLCLRVGDGNWPGVGKELLLPQEVFPVCAPVLAARLRAPADLLRVPVVADMNSNLSWDLWLQPHGLTAAELQPGNSFTDASLALDAAAAGQGAMLAWQTLAYDALRSGALVVPFPGRASTGFGYWLVWGESGRSDPLVAAFKRWIRAEIEATRQLFA